MSRQRKIDMSLRSDTLSRFRDHQSLLLLHSAVWLAANTNFILLLTGDSLWQQLYLYLHFFIVHTEYAHTALASVLFQVVCSLQCVMHSFIYFFNTRRNSILMCSQDILFFLIKTNLFLFVQKQILVSSSGWNEHSTSINIKWYVPV